MESAEEKERNSGETELMQTPVAGESCHHKEAVNIGPEVTRNGRLLV